MTTWMHGIAEDVGPEALSSTAAESANWLPRQTLAYVQQEHSHNGHSSSVNKS